MWNPFQDVRRILHLTAIAFLFVPLTRAFSQSIDVRIDPSYASTEQSVLVEVGMKLPNPCHEFDSAFLSQVADTFYCHAYATMLSQFCLPLEGPSWDITVSDEALSSGSYHVKATLTATVSSIITAWEITTADSFVVFDCGPCQAGNFDHIGGVDVADLTALVAFMFKGGDGPACAAEGDINGDGSMDVADVTALVGFMFKGGDAPVCP